MAVTNNSSIKCGDHNTRHYEKSQALSVDPAGQVATSSQSDAQLFAALARAVEQHVSDFNMQDLANTAWVFATVSQMRGCPRRWQGKQSGA